MASRKFRPYFQSHPITVVTAFPLKVILSKPDISGRLAKWAVELVEFGLEFQPRMAIKSQVLADFTTELQVEAERELFSLQARKISDPLQQWILEIDGSSNLKYSRLGIVLTSPEEDVIERIVRCAFKATNNEVEYEAMIAGLSLVKEIKVENLLVKSDSQLIVSQISGDFHTKNLRMMAYLEVKHVTSEKNIHADTLANLGSLVESSTARTRLVIIGQWPEIWGEKQQVIEEVHPKEEET